VGVERILLDPRRRGLAMAVKSLVVEKLGSRDLYIAIWEYMSRGCFNTGKALEGAAPHLFRPMYAQANMGHPSRTKDRGWEVKSAGAHRINLAKRESSGVSAGLDIELIFSESSLRPDIIRKQMAVLPGTRFGPYVIECLLGAGGMGRAVLYPVYKSTYERGDGIRFGEYEQYLERPRDHVGQRRFPGDRLRRNAP
jgi:hypothetical protein